MASNSDGKVDTENPTTSSSVQHGFFDDHELPVSKYDIGLTKVWKPCWIDYPAATRGLEKLTSIFRHPRTSRPPCCILVGDTNAGKTSLVKEFQRSLVSSSSTDDAENMPIVYIQCPPTADASALYTAILRRINAPFSPSWQPARKQDQVLRLLATIGARVLIVDELHNMLEGTPSQRGVFLNVIKHLSNELEISVIGVGTKPVLRVMQTDQQWGSRFEPFILPRWRNGKDYFEFLVQICLHADIEPGMDLRRKTVVDHIFRKCEGLTGETWKLMCYLIDHAIRTGAESIEADALDKIPWTPPRERRKAASEAI